MKPMISIIVPIYNVEKYLEICLQSILKQTYRNIEVILVDDGSSDRCPYICDFYSDKYENVKVIHKKNGGLSDARNVGLEIAKGEYILFVDSDDYIDINTCELFIKEIGYNEPDIVVGNARVIKDKNIKEMRHKYITTGIVTGEKYLKEELKTKTMYMSACLNLYRKSFLMDNNLKFRVGILHEDEEFTPRVFLKAQKVIGTGIIFYNYVIRNGSITRQKDLTKNAIDIISICYELEKIYNNIEDKELKILLYDNLVNKFLYAFQIGKLYKTEFNKLINKDFLDKDVYFEKTKFKVNLFCFNSKLYYFINYLEKKLRSLIYNE
ncbi:hypothetical protein CSTERLE_00685 [Thermoclostridium stercorarium subsp. leptospartum DSM 9219]|uniref:Glycosyltransferase 2-like domain-containing protein n=1 Tax=Thermoclostridium stercorarium subsp. leptospartum DSM 9219 TaxID=1346611 RepID=A0A1B1YHG2_THEST|nr:glycosyltransferase [Thermoclostridium stercorarium]ANX00210.1 hypothetical protein CSTERLE_00685 [Thermoclostridium stercorarium subsp. leptospartum DSM 9219]